MLLRLFGATVDRRDAAYSLAEQMTYGMGGHGITNELARSFEIIWRKEVTKDLVEIGEDIVDVIGRRRNRCVRHDGFFRSSLPRRCAE